MNLRISPGSIILSVYSALLLGCLHSKVETARLPSKISKKHADLLSRLSNYELVRPYRSTHEGEFVTHELSTDIEEELHDYHRSKRDTSQNTRRTRSTASDQQPRFHFAVSAFGSQFTLSVSRTRYIASPTFKVEKHMENGERVMFRPRTNCFYTGQVQNATSSTVAVSNCQGMSGLIRVENEEYIIEPLEEHREMSTNITQGHLHIMYNRRDWKGDTDHFDANYNFTHPRLMDDEMYREPRDDSREAELGRQKRQSISTYDREHHIETLITADYYVRDFHGEDYVVTYLMTMMHVVNVAYAHPSLEASIDLTVIRIILLNSAQSQNMVVENNAPVSLTNVCKWAYSQSSPDENHPDHYDHAVFLTRENFGPAGYAPVTGMCSMRRSCSLNKDEGLLSAFVVAHECGHVLGMEHDGQGGNSCEEDAMTGSIMAPVVIAVYNNFFWSDCSRSELHNYLWRYTCLYDDPFDNGYAELQEHPGERYSMDEQCRFDFGDGWRVCRQTFRDFMVTCCGTLAVLGDKSFGEYNPCEQLWCVDIHDPYYCKTKKGPPLDGTTCAPGMWCMQGECVYTDTERQDGHWSDWSSWSECSYQCDTGAEVRTRDCNNPPPLNGGNPCKGSRLDYRICNTQECRRPSSDRRAAQCDENLANWQFRGRTHTWLPHENRNKTLQCRLTCLSKETGDVVVTEYNVADGTPCSYDDHESVCIQGQCVYIGCDKQVETPAKADICGVCMGDNTNCDLIKGRFEQAPKKNYQIVVNIPAGARNIDVRQVGSTDHFLAVKETGTKNYVLNAKKRQRQTHDFVFANARFVYINNGDVEMLAAKGPVVKGISLAIFWKNTDSKPANISYQYHVNLLEDQNKYANIPETKPPKRPIIVTPNPPIKGEVIPGPTEPNAIPELDPELIIPDVGTNPDYIWEALGWTQCSRSCNRGNTFYQYQCTSRITGKRVKYKMCGQNRYNSKGIKRACNTHPCNPPTSPRSDTPENTPSRDLQNNNDQPIAPERENTGDSNTPHNTGGSNTRSTSPPNNGGGEITSNTKNTSPPNNGGGGSTSNGGSGGITSPPNNNNNTPTIPQVRFLWEIGQWEECSRTCGTEGSQRRSIRCLKVRPSGNSSTNPKKCPGEEPPTRQPCNQTPCKAFWSTGDWNECSATCGSGTQTRDVICAAASDRPGEFECFDDRPESSRDCEIEPCPSTECVPMPTRICKPKLFEKYCDLPGYADICCSTCELMREKRAAKRDSARARAHNEETL